MRELVKAAAASLNGNVTAMCGAVSVLYCTSHANQRGCLSPEHMSNVLIPAMSSLLRLPSLNFVDLSRQGCRAVHALIDRMSSSASLSLVIIDANVAHTSSAVDDDEASKNESSKNTDAAEATMFGELDSLVSCALKAVNRDCRLKILLVLPKTASSAQILSRFPSITNASSDFLTLCHLQTESVECWDSSDDNAAAASVSLLFSLLCILRTSRYDSCGREVLPTCWWESWGAETAILETITPPLMTAFSMLKSRSLNTVIRPASRAIPASRISTQSSSLSRRSTSSLATKTDAFLRKPSALECINPAIICTFADDMNGEEVYFWFKSGGSRIVTEKEDSEKEPKTGSSGPILTEKEDSEKEPKTERSGPILVCAARYGSAATAMVATELCRELITSLKLQLGQEAELECSAQFEDAQAELSRLILCHECEQRGLILVLPSRSSAIMHCFNMSIFPIPSHVIIMLLAPARIAQQVQTWLHPTIQTHLQDAGAALVQVCNATVFGARMPACVIGHESSVESAEAAEDAASNEASISWTRIYDTRCAMMMHRDFPKVSFAKSSSSCAAKQSYLPPRASSPYSPKASPRLGSPSSGRNSPNGDRRSPLSASLIRKIPRSSSCQSLAIACDSFSSQAVIAVIGTVLAMPGIPLHLISQAANAIALEMARGSGDMMPNALPSHRELTSTAVCLAPFFFDTRVCVTGLSFHAKFPNLQESFEVHFGVSWKIWETLQQGACLSLVLVADPFSDGTYAGLAGAGSWLCENLMVLLLNTNCHGTACEVASNVLHWHAVHKVLGSMETLAVLQRCSGILEYFVLQEGLDSFKLRILRSTQIDLRAMLEVIQMNLRDSRNVGILEGIVLRIWLSPKPAISLINLATSALNRIAALQDRVLEVFKHSARTLQSSAPGCVWRLLQRANAAEWLSHVRFPAPVDCTIA